MITRPKRDELARFLPSQKTIRAFEELFDNVNELNSLIGETRSETNQQNSEFNKELRRNKGDRVLLWLSMQ